MFMLVAGGVLCGIVLIFVEIAYKKRKDKNVKEHDLSRNAFATWRKKVEKKKLTNNGQFINLLDNNRNYIPNTQNKIILSSEKSTANEIVNNNDHLLNRNVKFNNEKSQHNELISEILSESSVPKILKVNGKISK